LEINGLNTYYTDKGEGETVVLLHGWGGSSVSMLGLMNEFQNNYRVLTLDLWGFGKSATPSKETTIFDYAVWVGEFLNMLNIEKAHIVGHSFGGRIGIILGSIFPEKVQTLTLIDSAGLRMKKTRKQKKQEEEYKKLKLEVESGEQDPMVLKKYGSSDYKNLSGEMRDVFVRVVNTDLSKDAMNVSVPTNIIWGKKDEDTPPIMAKKLKRYIRGSKINWLNGGHYAYLMEQNKVVEMCYRFWGIM
jgi:pimeloyl-ACP methyl ester carboxylesterase